MSTIIGNGLRTYKSIQQTDKQNHVRNKTNYQRNAAEQLYEDVQSVSAKDSGISTQEAYERLGGSSKALLGVGQSASLDGETKVTEIEVASLSNGVSFYFHMDTGEVSCVDVNDNRPGRHALWSKTLSAEEMERCDKLFDNYEDKAAGHFVFRYRAYLKHEEFWDRYLEGKVDLTTLIEEDNTLSEDELYNKFLQDTISRGDKRR